MNILFMNSIAPLVWGGGEKWMLTAAEGLRGRGHEITICGRKGSLFLSRCHERRIAVAPLRIGSDFGLRNILRLRRIYRERKTDVVIANFNKDVRLAGLAACGGGPRIVARNGLPLIQNNWRYRLTYTAFAKGILTNAEAIKRRYLSYGWFPEDFIKVIHNGIDVDQIVEFPGPAVVAKHKIPFGRPIIGIFGRLVGQKQHHLFLETAKRVAVEVSETVFIVVGEGPLEADLRRLAAELGIAEKVLFMGFQREPMPLYSVCDVVLLTSRSEGLPNVVMEAMLAARAVVAFDVGGVRELIPNEETGIVVPEGDVAGMAARAVELLRDPEARGRIGGRARARIIAEFSVGGMVGELEGWLGEKVTPP